MSEPSFEAHARSIPYLPSLMTALRREPWRNLLPCLLVALLGSLALSPVIAHLWKTWTTDGLRSIGMFFPPTSAILTLLVWRRLNWENRGTWWGLLPMFYSMAAAHAEDNTFVHLVLTPKIDFSLISRGLTLFAYGSGVILLFGGVRVWRQAIFPLSLLLFVDPAPHFFNDLVDLPLQYISASTTRAFALAIGVHPDGNQLRLMFTPNFGMFIAPGCDGVRGGLTMSYLALILGYLYKFSIRLRILAVVCALALGYAFNLIRLCALVLYYWLALRLQFLQAHAEMADYLIGFVLFVVGTALFVLLIKWNRRDESDHRVVETDDSSRVRQEGGRNDTLSWKLLVSSTLIALAASPYVYGYFMRDDARNGRGGDELNVASAFPAQVGRYTLLKTWQARDTAQNLIYSWATYSTDHQASEVDLGVWSRSEIHYPIWCHLSRGEKPVWSAVRTLSTANGTGTFQIYSYLVGNSFLLEASTICTSSGCYESGNWPFHRGISFRTAGFGNFIFQSFSRTRPVLIRKRTTAIASSSPIETTRTFVEFEDFVSHLNTSDLGQFVKSRNR